MKELDVLIGKIKGIKEVLNGINFQTEISVHIMEGEYKIEVSNEYVNRLYTKATEVYLNETLPKKLRYMELLSISNEMKNILLNLINQK